ncbi:hypothetical protein DEO72_LG2g3672 [Vigna unguiculata]|uniref:Uncharacterized protein n=1 Tax=Vigna unguiculata TaxID=3917 RepID=A0A4D6L4C5_VIGUN|nr:hypothetical protein DEO72_LG2g3672 [Vigna unguiculata]
METVIEVREDPPEEIAESSWPAKTGYEWAVADVRNQSSLFRWSRLLNSWLNFTPVLGRDVSRDIMSLEQVNAVERVCHGQEGAADKFFYMYMCHFSQLHVRLLFDNFTMGDGFFKAVVKEAGRPYFYNDDRSTKFPFSWTDNPWRYKNMKIEKLSVTDKEVVEMLMKHMAQLGKKNLTLFQTLRKEKAARTKAAKSTEASNLQESLVEVHVHGGTKRKAELPTRPGKGKDVKKIRVALLGSGSSTSGKGPEAGLIELSETVVQQNIEINMSETLINSIDSVEPNALVRAMMEFNSKALILGRRLTCGKGGEIKQLKAYKAVAYTHLDVYKRQQHIQ